MMKIPYPQKYRAVNRIVPPYSSKGGRDNSIDAPCMTALVFVFFTLLPRKAHALEVECTCSVLNLQSVHSVHCFPANMLGFPYSYFYNSQN